MYPSRLAVIDRKLHADRSYWLEQLSGEVVAATLPPDLSPRADGIPVLRHSVPFRLDADVAVRLQERCGGQPALLLAALIAALDTTLHKYTGLRDLTVGTPIHEAHADATAYNHLLAIRTRVDPASTLAALLRDVKQTLADAFTHQRYPFERLVTLLDLDRGGPSSDPSPLVRAVVLLEGIQNPTRIAGLPTDFAIACCASPGSLTGSIDYDATRFERTAIDAFARSFARVLRAIAFEPTTPIERVGLIDPEERRAAIETFNATRASYPADRPIHRLIEEQSAATPERVALVCGERRLTYREMNARANQVAHHLRRQGAGPGSIVGIRMEHSIDEVVALLGVLKAGAAYVPCDPAHPAERIAYMAEDARFLALLTDDEPDRAAVAGEAVDNLESGAGPDDLAYVIYTSGSTGQPKGVKIQHRALVNYVWWAREVYTAGAPLDFALYSSLAFDLTVTSIFVPLISGGAVVVYPGGREDLPLIDVVNDAVVDVVKLTPSHLALLAGRDLRGSRIRSLIVGGESLDTGVALAIHEAFGGRVDIFNEYGPTEATVGCMIHRFDPQRDRRRVVPIGRPAANARIYLLDPQLEPVVTGAIGEIFIAGDGLAAGYLNRDELTAQSFVADPFEPGARMYRTGDRGRRLPDGLLEFLGRADDQIKFNGYRIDLNEYRHALNAHPQIRESVVRLVEGPDGRLVLVAYYVSRHELEVGELRAFLGRRLIEGTLPNVYAHLRRLPLTLNGKVNHRALPSLEEIRSRVKPGATPPRTPTEMALARIWSDILGLESVGVHDNFFELGGHSLLATQVISRLRDVTGVELPLRSVFEAPTVAGLASRVEEQTATGADDVRPAPIPRRERAGDLALSFAQQRLWFLDQLDPGSPVYNVTARLDLRGPLDLDVLRRSLEEIVQRHESLRTTFAEVEGQPAQAIRQDAAVPFDVVDLGQQSEAARSGIVDREAADEFTKPFDLQAGPLLRARVLALGVTDHVLLFSMHHIVADGWSMGVLIEELATLYEAFAAGRPSPLPPLDVQYADFAAWQREQMQGERLDEQLAYWKAQLANLSPLELPTDRPRGAVQTFRGSYVPVAISGALSDRVRRFSRESGSTPFMTLLAAFTTLLHRYSRQDDIAVGSPIANRGRSELEPLIGFFANTLVLRSTLAGDPTFRELVGRVKDTALAAYAHQDVPFERLVEELQPERDLSHNPLFQVMLALQNAPIEPPRLAGVEVRRLPGDTGTAKFDLNLLLEDADGGFAGTLEYNSDLFDRRTIERMAGHLVRLLDAAVEAPDTRIADLPLLGEDERRQLLVEWNNTWVDYPEPVCVHDVVEQMVRERPDAPAVAFGDRVLTYRELNVRANQVAHFLRKLAVGPDVLVGVCLERSIEMAVGVLGILKAGGAYVPLDPEYPADRLAFMISDAAAPVLLAQTSTRHLLPAQGARIVCLDTDWDVIAEEPTDDPPDTVSPENLLYAIYTSGSTGRPKGTALSHRALANLIRWSIGAIPGGTAMLQFASLSFDASFHEMFAAWCSGRLLVMIPESWRRDPEELLRYLEQHRVETAILPVVVLHQWAEHHAQDSSRFAQFSDIVTTGEQLVITQPIVDLFTKLERCTLHNHYGPSETHVVTAFTLERPPSTWPSRPSIGRPIANTDIYILDARFNPVPIGVPGDLYLGGANLARGYLGRPDLTASKFVPHPFSDVPGARLYAVGDLGRYRADGTIEFLGRLDHQVKVRGFRVELGEVEAAVNRHPKVSQSVAVVHGETPSDKRLVAYVVPVAGEAITATELREFMSEQLPDYLVPAVFMVLENLALTPNGKIDRRALPAPSPVSAADAHAFVPPTTASERLVAGLWSEVLGPQRVGLHDNFFHAGGHSLLATQLVSRIRRAFDIDLPLRTMFEAPTVSGLVIALGRAAGGAEIVEEIASTLLAVAEMSAGDVSAMLDEMHADRGAAM